jgi:hypothetical protein
MIIPLHDPAMPTFEHDVRRCCHFGIEVIVEQRRMLIQTIRLEDMGRNAIRAWYIVGRAMN